MVAKVEAGPGPARCLIYLRVSSVAQEAYYSLATQEAACRDFARARGWTIVGREQDVHSGTDLHGRPRLAAARELIRAGGVDVLLAHALDRLSRKQAHVAIVADECERHGARLAFVTEDFERSAIGEFIRSAKAFAAEVEHQKIVERTQRGLRARVGDGKPLAGPRPPYGYRWETEVDDKGRAVKRRLALDEAAASVVRRIFDAALRGESLRSIARTLTAEGVATPTGRSAHWDSSTVSRILSDPRYAGRSTAYRWSKEKLPDGRCRIRRRHESEHVDLPDGLVPPLVTADEFAAVRARLSRNKAEASRNNPDPEATLLRAGFARCGYCGGPLAVKRRGDGRDGPHYRCSPTNADRYGCPAFTVSARVLDEAAWSRVAAVLTRPAIVAAAVEQQRAAPDPVPAELVSTERRLAKVERRLRNLRDRLADEEDSDVAALVQADMRALVAERRELHVEWEALSARAVAATADRDRLADLAEWCARVAGNLPTLTYAERRDAMLALGVSVKVWRSDHAPRWEIEMAPMAVNSTGDIERHTVQG